MKRLVLLVAIGVLLAGGGAEARGAGGGPIRSSRSTRVSSGGTGTGSSSQSHSVRGHLNKNGVYVPPHRQTNPNGTQRDNYGAKGNYNPNTGKTGTKPVTK